MNALINKLRVAMNMPANVSELITYGWSIHTSMTKNAINFQQSSSKLNELGVSLHLLEGTQAGLKLNPPTTTTTMRNTTEKQVRNWIRLLSYDVQESADNKPEQAAEIIDSSGMSIKKANGSVARENSIVKGNNMGEIIITSQFSGAHQWQQSNDGGETFHNLTPTLVSFTIISGLVEGQKYWFRQRTMKPNSVYGAWSNWESYTVV